MDADRTLEILIKLGYVGADQADAAKRDLATFKDGTGDLTQKLEEQGETETKLTSLHREMHSALLAIANQSPITGAALGSVFLGPVGAIIGAIALFREAKSALDDYNKGLDQEAAAAAESFDNSVKNMQDAVDALAKAHASFIAQLGGAGADNDPIATQIRNENALYDEQLKAIKKIIEAHDKLIGKTPDQIAADLSTIDDQKEKHTLDQLKREHDLRVAQQADLEKKAFESQKAESDASEKLKSKTDERATLEKQIVDDSKKAREAAQKVQDTSLDILIPPASGFGSPTLAPNPAFATAQQEAQRAREDLKRAQERHAQLSRELQPLENDAATYRADQQRAESAATQNKTRVGDLNRQIGQQQDIDRTNAAGRSENAGVGIADRIAAGGKVTADQARYLTDLAAAIAGHQVTLAQAVTVMEMAARNPAALATQIERITTILSAFDPSAINRLDRRLDQLESQMANHGP